MLRFLRTKNQLLCSQGNVWNREVFGNIFYRRRCLARWKGSKLVYRIGMPASSPLLIRNSWKNTMIFSSKKRFFGLKNLESARSRRGKETRNFSTP